MAAKIYSVCKYEKVESQVNSNILKNPVNEISLQSVRDIFIIKYASDRRDSIGTEIYCDSGGGNPGSENFCSQILGRRNCSCVSAEMHRDIVTTQDMILLFWLI